MEDTVVTKEKENKVVWESLACEVEEDRRPKRLYGKVRPKWKKRRVEDRMD